jgi:GNAT superfamily N-acetyltransferase
MNLYPFDATNPFHLAVVTSIWNAACGDDLAITPRFVAYNTHPATGVIQSGQIAMLNGQPVGFVLASTLPNNPAVAPAQLGWIDAIAVLPTAQKQGIGSALLKWAEEWLRTQGCSRFRLGGSLKPFAPGLPVELNTEDFFRKRGFVGGKQDWDVASDLDSYVRRTFSIASRIEIRPAQIGDKQAMLAFFNREFPNRWRFEFEEFLREQGRLSDYMLLLTNRGVDGFARLTFEDSERPIERFFMHRLPKPWGQLGPIGVSKDTRGKGFGGALLDAALCRLRDLGIHGCVIDWTSLVDFYGKFGFNPYRQYAMLIKT